jgi:hypothetical protein
MYDEIIQINNTWLEDMTTAVEKLQKSIETSTRAIEDGKTAEEKLYGLQWIEQKIEKHLAYVEAQIKKIEASNETPDEITIENFIFIKDDLKSLQARAKDEILKTKDLMEK